MDSKKLEDIAKNMINVVPGMLDALTEGIGESLDGMTEKEQALFAKQYEDNKIDDTLLKIHRDHAEMVKKFKS